MRRGGSSASHASANVVLQGAVGSPEGRQGVDITSSAIAVSRTLRASGPLWSRPPHAPWPSGSMVTRPRVGLIPTTPQHDAGMRIEPPASVPWASGKSPAARPAPAPPLEPPGDRSRFHGLWVSPWSSLRVAGSQASSGVLVLQRMTAPAARSRPTIAASNPVW